MSAREIISELADPDSVIGLEDYILLKLENPWTPPRRSASVQLPGGLHLDEAGQLITATEGSFVANFAMLCEARVVAALFAGCGAFDASKSLVFAARKVLSKAQKLVIVHNRDYVVRLVDWFRSIDVLVLYHDLRFQTLPEDAKPLHGPRWPQLQRLLGTAPALGLKHLYIMPKTLHSLVSCCPQLNEIQTGMQEILLQQSPLLSRMLAREPPFLRSPSLVLGMDIERLDGRTITDPFSDIPPEVVIRASELFRRTQILELTSSCFDTITEVRRFTDITDLSLIFADGRFFPFGSLLDDVLAKLPLKRLALKFVSRVSLAAIARNWPDMESLTLLGCSIANDKQHAVPGALPGLTHLGLRLHGNEEDVQVANSLLHSMTQLTSLRIDGATLLLLFVALCRTERFPNLQRLTLGTDKQLRELSLAPDDLRCLVGALPSLRHVSTDSFDFRLFFQHFMPGATLAWCHCTTCAAEFPLLNELQNVIWIDFHGPK